MIDPSERSGLPSPADTSIASRKPGELQPGISAAAEETRLLAGEYKPRLCATPSRFRPKVSDVTIINPFDVLTDLGPDSESGDWNPLCGLDPGSPGFADDCLAITRAETRQAPPCEEMKQVSVVTTDLASRRG
jgi:hypothetical protein